LYLWPQRWMFEMLEYKGVFTAYSGNIEPPQQFSSLTAAQKFCERMLSSQLSFSPSKIL
jgi:hypothetical protein